MKSDDEQIRRNTRWEETPSLPLPRFALPEVVGVAMSAEDIADVVQHSVEEMCEGLQCSRLIALSYSPQEGLLRGVTTVGCQEDTLRDLRLPLSQFPVVERVVRTKRILVLPDAADALLPPFSSHLTGETAIVPLALNERVLAVLIGQIKPGVAARSAAWQERAEEVAARAALVVELERLATAYQDEARLRNSSRAFAAAILEGRPLLEIAEQILNDIEQRLREDRIGLFVTDWVTGLMTPVCLRNVSQRYGESIQYLAQRSPILARARVSDLPYHARNVQDNPQISTELRAELAREDIRSVLIVVLRYGEEMKGALAIYPRDERQFTPMELSIFKGFADQAAMAVAVTQLLDQQRDIAMHEERNRLAREIHDTVAQSLVGLLIKMQTALADLEAGNRETVAEILRAASAQTQKSLEETRRAVQGLAPFSLERLSASQAIAEETRQFEVEENIAAQFISTGEEQALTAEQSAALLRITQEALMNARKHAQARRLRVGLHYAVDEVTLVVEDDGVGFDTEARPAPGPQGGYGLFGMNERARLLGGELRVESTPGWGTRIHARLPYRSVPLAPAPRQTESTGDRDSAIRVLIADDHTVTREGIRAMLETSDDFQVVAEASDGEQAIALVEQFLPDVVVMDVQMPRVNGIEALRRLHEAAPSLPVVILTTFQTDASVAEALGAGARGYLLKDAGSGDILAAVRAAFRGESLLAPAVAERLSALASGHAIGAAGLNEREMETLLLLARGARNREIAARLFITPKTVEYHLSNLFAKLGVSNRTEAVRAAFERALISPGALPPK